MALRQPVEPRFLAKVQKTGMCWLWTAWLDRNGYGRFWLDGRNLGAHRVAYELFVGPIPAGLEIDHLCRVRNCVNPEHLEPVTTAENVRRGTSANVIRELARDRTSCRKGHPYVEENLYIDRKGNRGCLTCKKDGARRYYERHRELTIRRAAEWSRANPDRARELGREAQRRQRAKKKAAA
jgi:hypothetical protein